MIVRTGRHCPWLMISVHRLWLMLSVRRDQGGQGHEGLPHCGHALPPGHISGGEALGLHVGLAGGGGGGGGGGEGGVGVGGVGEGAGGFGAGAGGGAAHLLSQSGVAYVPLSLALHVWASHAYFGGVGVGGAGAAQAPTSSREHTVRTSMRANSV